MGDELATLARRLCLQNAIQHDGTCQPKGLVGRIMGAHPEHRGDPQAVMAALMAAGETVNALSPEEQKAALEAEAPELLDVQKKERRTGLKPLPGDTSKVVLRFAPNPNGPLSLGHSRGLAILSAYRREVGAKLILRLDDTDPQVKPPLWDEERGWNGYRMVEEDFAWLTGHAPDVVVKASDRIAAYHDAARELIDHAGAYVCFCPTEAFRERKNRGAPCPHRELPLEDQREAFEGMVSGAIGPGAAVLRVKTDIQHPDPALRDWTAFRVVADDAVHPRTRAGEIPDHRCWPLLDFQSAVEDHFQGVTHVIRGKDLMDSTKKQMFLYAHMGWTYPETLYWGRISLHGFGKFSTSMMRKSIEDGTCTGWDDPRLPTLRALARRGFDPGALRRFWIGLGLTEKDIAVSMDNIEAENAKVVDPEAPRLFFVPEPRHLRIEGAEDMEAHPAVHPNHPERGKRTLRPGTEVVVPAADLAPRIRLKDLGNVSIEGDKATFEGTDMDRRVPIVQWVPADDRRPFVVLRPPRPQDDAIPQLAEVLGDVEPAVADHVGKVVQFERFGLVKVESADHGVWLHE